MENIDKTVKLLLNISVSRKKLEEISHVNFSSHLWKRLTCQHSKRFINTEPQLRNNRLHFCCKAQRTVLYSALLRRSGGNFLLQHSTGYGMGACAREFHKPFGRNNPLLDFLMDYHSPVLQDKR